MRKVEIPAAESVRAISCPLYLDAKDMNPSSGHMELKSSQGACFGDYDSKVPIVGSSLKVRLHGF